MRSKTKTDARRKFLAIFRLQLRQMTFEQYIANVFLPHLGMKP